MIFCPILHAESCCMFYITNLDSKSNDIYRVFFPTPMSDQYVYLFSTSISISACFKKKKHVEILHVKRKKSQRLAITVWQRDAHCTWDTICAVWHLLSLLISFPILNAFHYFCNVQGMRECGKNIAQLTTCLVFSFVLSHYVFIVLRYWRSDKHCCFSKQQSV